MAPYQTAGRFLLKWREYNIDSMQKGFVKYIGFVKNPCGKCTFWSNVNRPNCKCCLTNITKIKIILTKTHYRNKLSLEKQDFMMETDYAWGMEDYSEEN